MEPTMEVESEGAGFAYAREKKKKKKAKGTDSSLPLPKGNLGDTTEPGSSQRCTVKTQEVTVMSYKGNSSWTDGRNSSP